MTHSTDRPAHMDVPKPPGWCDWHGNVDPTSRVVIEINRSSGPPHDQSACATCRHQYKLQALSELDDATQPQLPTSARAQQREGQ